MKHTLEVAIRSGSICLAGLFLIAVAHKVRVVARGRPEAEPLLRLSGRRRRHARGILTLAAAGEGATAGLLLASPGLGYALATIATVGYAVAAIGLRPHERCACFGGAFEAKGAAAVIRRNLAIAVASAGCTALYATASIRVAAGGRAAAMAAVIGSGVVASTLARVAVTRPPSSHQSTGSET